MTFLTRDELRVRLAALKTQGGSEHVLKFIDDCERRLDAEERQDKFLDAFVEGLFQQRVKKKDAYLHPINY